MKTKNIWANVASVMIALVSVVAVGFAFSACSNKEDEPAGPPNIYQQWETTENGTTTVIDLSEEGKFCMLIKYKKEYAEQNNLDPSKYYIMDYVPCEIQFIEGETKGSINANYSDGFRCFQFKNLTTSSLTLNIDTEITYKLVKKRVEGVYLP